MATHVNIPATGNGDPGPIPVATIDDVAGDKHQKFVGEFLVGTTPTPITSAAPLPVVQTGTPALPTGASTETTLAAANTAIGTTADAASSTTGTVIAHLRKIRDVLVAGLPALVGGKVPVDASGTTLTVGSHAVTNAGTFAVQADTELAAAAALGDTDANPTTAQVGAALQGWTGTVWQRLKSALGDGASANGLLNLVPMMFNGTTYDRLRGDATNGLKVNGSGVTQPVSDAGGSLTVDAPVGTPAFVRLSDGAAAIATLPVSQASPVQSGTATLANVAASATSVTLQAGNAAREGLVIVNDSTAILYVKFGSAASSTSFTYFLAGSVGGVPATLELPATVYTGIVTGIWASAVGSARVTELT